jgi:hypothetical protein
MGNVCVVGGYTGRPENRRMQLAALCHCGIAGSRRLSGSLAAFFVSNLDNEFRVAVVRPV